MRPMFVIPALLVAVLAVPLLAASAAEGPGSCGKGKIWDADKKECVPKPRGSGSGSG